MKNLTKISSRIILTIILLGAAVLVSLGWGNPGANPPLGSGAITTDTTGNVGIGIGTPGSKLSVNGAVSIGSTYASQAAPASGLIVEGNVGIGTQSPTAKFEVASSDIKIGSGNPFLGLLLNLEGKLGIGTTTPKFKLQINNGDIYIDTSLKGLILKAPNDSCYRVTIDNFGVFSAGSAINCPI